MIRRVIQESKELVPWPMLVEKLSVTFDDKTIHICADFPTGDSWSHWVQWADVERVCFVCEGVLASDGIYVFTRFRPIPYPIPAEAEGGPQIWGEIIRRDLFPAEMAIDMVNAEGSFFVWPPNDISPIDTPAAEGGSGLTH